MEIVKKLMTGDEEIAEIEAEIERARTDLHDALNEIGAKVTNVEVAFTPEHLVRSYPLTAAGAAAALGFVLGSVFGKRATMPIAILTLLGYTIAREAAGKSEDPVA